MLTEREEQNNMDLKIIETYSGGDLVFSNGDLRLTSEVYNQPYLAHFGGNKEQTADEYSENLPREDYWANQLLLPPNERLDSLFERSLLENEISSSGRLRMEEAAKTDLIYLEGFAETESEVIIEGVDKIRLSDKINNENIGKFMYIWNEAKNEDTIMQDVEDLYLEEKLVDGGDLSYSPTDHIIDGGSL
jgi:hypothetical protein